MFITVYYVAGLGHNWDADEYYVEFTTVHANMEEAVAAAIQITQKPETGIVKTEVYREGQPSDAAFNKAVWNERRRQQSLLAKN